MRIGLTLNDFFELSVSTILDIVTVYINQMDDAEEKAKGKESKKPRKATQSDIDAFFR